MRQVEQLVRPRPHGRAIPLHRIVGGQAVQEEGMVKGRNVPVGRLHLCPAAIARDADARNQLAAHVRLHGICVRYRRADPRAR